MAAVWLLDEREYTTTREGRRIEARSRTHQLLNYQPLRGKTPESRTQNHETSRDQETRVRTTPAAMPVSGTALEAGRRSVAKSKPALDAQPSHGISWTPGHSSGFVCLRPQRPIHQEQDTRAAPGQLMKTASGPGTTATAKTRDNARLLNRSPMVGAGEGPGVGPGEGAGVGGDVSNPTTSAVRSSQTSRRAGGAGRRSTTPRREVLINKAQGERC